jgi:hypothetical protein
MLRMSRDGEAVGNRLMVAAGNPDRETCTAVVLEQL